MGTSAKSMDIWPSPAMSLSMVGSTCTTMRLTSGRTLCRHFLFSLRKHVHSANNPPIHVDVRYQGQKRVSLCLAQTFMSYKASSFHAGRCGNEHGAPFRNGGNRGHQNSYYHSAFNLPLVEGAHALIAMQMTKTIEDEHQSMLSPVLLHVCTSPQRLHKSSMTASVFLT